MPVSVGENQEFCGEGLSPEGWRQCWFGTSPDDVCGWAADGVLAVRSGPRRHAVNSAVRSFDVESGDGERRPEGSERTRRLLTKRHHHGQDLGGGQEHLHGAGAQVGGRSRLKQRRATHPRRPHWPDLT
eukprot:171412-Rhodomonas_salina.2